MDRALAEKAAKWWADQLRKPAKLDNGDKSENGAMSMMLGMLAQQTRPPIPDDKIKAFEAALIAALMEEGDRWVAVGVDYHPDYMLQQAAEKAGLSIGMTDLPWKTMMNIHDGKVLVSEGSGAPIIEL